MEHTSGVLIVYRSLQPTFFDTQACADASHRAEIMSRVSEFDPFKHITWFTDLA